MPKIPVLTHVWFRSAGLYSGNRAADSDQQAGSTAPLRIDACAITILIVFELFCIYYKQERKGRLFYFREGTNPKYRFDFGDEGGQIETNNLADIDEIILRLFTKRVGGNVDAPAAENATVEPEAGVEAEAAV